MARFMQVGSMLSVDVIVNYVFKHPGCSALFPGWDRQQIVYALCQASMDDELYVITHQDMIAGILIASVDDNEQQIYVKQILTTPKTPALVTFLAAWKTRYPTYKVVGLRQGSKRMEYTLRNFRYERRKQVLAGISELASA